MVKIGINGFGRIGRMVFRAAVKNFSKDIQIVETGLRPGEKLYEELLADGETTKPTHHQQIFIAEAHSLELQEVESLVSDATVEKNWLEYISEYQQL